MMRHPSWRTADTGPLAVEAFSETAAAKDPDSVMCFAHLRPGTRVERVVRKTHHTRIPVRGAASFTVHRRHGTFTPRRWARIHQVKIPDQRRTNVGLLRRIRERGYSEVRPYANKSRMNAERRKIFFVYNTASKPRGVLYAGMTSDLPWRVTEHRDRMLDGFTKKYWAGRLVYYEFHETAESAAKREKLLKRWRRDWKIKLAEDKNPTWRDLYNDVLVEFGFEP